MNQLPQHDLLRNLFATAMDAPAAGESSTAPGPPGTPHPIDDDDLLLDWSLGDLSPARREQLLDHLAACPPCRREIAAMIRAGALVLPHVAASLRDAEPGLGETGLREEAAAVPVATVRPWRRRAALAVVAALAASLLLMLARGVFDSGPADRATLVALAQRDLDAGRPGEAFSRMESLLSGDPDAPADHRARAVAILETSGYELARRSLGHGDFAGVTAVEHRAARGGAASARLTNLRLQAERGETIEQSLSRRRSLVRDYGYEPDGRRGLKDFSIPEITPTVRRLEAELAAAVREYPASVDLWLNYGQFLVEQNRYREAVAQFAEAVRRDPTNALAQTGLGLALFQQNRPETIAQALAPFRAAVAVSPDDPDANLNLALCLTRLGRQAEARPYFEKTGVSPR